MPSGTLYTYIDADAEDVLAEIAATNELIDQNFAGRVPHDT